MRTTANDHAAARAGGTGGALPFLTLRAGPQDYALAIDAVVEVAAMVELIPLAGGPPAALGLVNRRGAPLLLLDLSAALSAAATAQVGATPGAVLHKNPSADTLFIVVRGGADTATDATLLGLVADEIHGVEYVAGIAQLAARSTDGAVSGVIQARGRMMQVIAAHTLVNAYVPPRRGPGQA
jgi:chemotaxis signal transduction protein